MKQTHFLLTTALAVFLGISCGLFPPLAGNGSEITNGCCIIARTGKPAESAMVIAFPHGYVPVQIIPDSISPETTFTDTAGRFSIKLGDSACNLLIYDRTGTYGAFVPFVPIEHDSSLRTIMLDSLGYLQGMNSDSTAEYVGIIGSPFSASVRDLDTFTIVKAPPFTYAIVVWRKGLIVPGPYPGPKTGISGAIDTTVTVNPGKGANINITPHPDVMVIIFSTRRP